MNPEDINKQFERAFNAGDLDGLIALYEPDATLVLDTGPVRGTDSIRQALAGFLASKPTIQIEPGQEISGGSDLALTSSRWRLKGTGQDGNPVEVSGQSVEVVRRQAGRWRYVIDCPFGVR